MLEPDKNVVLVGADRDRGDDIEPPHARAKRALSLVLQGHSRADIQRQLGYDSIETVWKEIGALLQAVFPLAEVMLDAKQAKAPSSVLRDTRTGPTVNGPPPPHPNGAAAAVQPRVQLDGLADPNLRGTPKHDAASQLVEGLEAKCTEFGRRAAQAEKRTKRAIRRTKRAIRNIAFLEKFVANVIRLIRLSS